MGIEGVKITPLSIIDTPGGDVFHAMKCSDPGYVGFGEAYFSTIEAGAIKAWKRHHNMVLNLVVPLGSICFVLYDDRSGIVSCGQFQELIISSKKNYCRLTVPPMVWFGFQGLGNSNSMLLNIASIEHSPDEVDRKDLEEIKFNWKGSKS